MSKLDAVVADAHIIVSCGSGGVGKTTAAAAIALHAAKIGKRVVVVTIDPARRLADAFGIAGGLTNDPTRVPHDESTAGGELWAMMLDPATTFDGLIKQYAATDDQAQRILANAFYRNVAGALSGTQDYMAAEKLYELHEDERFDVVVVDTPPTRNALDFLEAPARLTRFLDHRIYRALTTPTRVGLKVVNVAAQAFLRTLSRVVGGEAIADAIAFFQAFDGMEEGFRARAQVVAGLLESADTAYVIVTAPRRDTVIEARFFAQQLVAKHAPVAGIIVNRVHPRFAPDRVAKRGRRGAHRAELEANLAELTTVAEREAAVLEPLAAELSSTPIATVPLLALDVHDLGGLAAIAEHLFR